jgi:glycerophosphoryl diester phosphodiesterase
MNFRGSRRLVWIVPDVLPVPFGVAAAERQGLSRRYREPVVHVLVSAHRCGGAVDRAYDNSPAGVRWAASIGADYVEFDVRRAGDGSLVCSHDPLGGEVAPSPLAGVLAAVAETGLGAHVDLKGTGCAAWAVDLARQCAAVLDETLVVYTTGDPAAAAALAGWTREHDSPALVGLTVGSGTSHLRLTDTLRTRVRELYPSRQWRASGAGVLVAHHVLARLRLLRWARRRGVRVLVWTADAPRVVAAALKDPRVWMLTTNRPEAALRMRDAISR